MAINVLMLGWELPPYNSGGLGTACLGLTQALASQGVGIDFVVPKLFGPLPYSHMRVIGAAEYRANIAHLSDALLASQLAGILQQTGYGRPMSAAERLERGLQALGTNDPTIPAPVQADWYAAQVAQIAQENSFDVVHSHDWMTFRAGQAAKEVAATRGRETPFVAHVHATELDRSGENGNSEIITLEKEGFDRADRVIAVSHYTKNLIHRHYDVPRHKISVVHNGINPGTPPSFNFSELKKRHKIVLFMGRITRQKGPDYFVRLAKQVTDRDPSVRFVMVGSGDMEERCIEEAARSGLTGKMLFSSFLRGDDVNRAYQLADLFVMPSVSEPFGIAALEAMQNGTPVIASKQSGIGEVSANLIRVDFWDIDKMASTVLEVLHTPDLHRLLKEKTQEELPRVSWQNSASNLRSLYDTLITLPPSLTYA